MATPAPTPRPTPLGAYQYRTQFGDSSFGFRSRNDFDGAWQYSFKRPGWSWQEPLSGTTGPFCYGPDSKCWNVTLPCNDLGGTLLHDSVCSFPQDTKIMGPSCWKGNCVAKGKSTCTSLGGVHVGVDDGMNGPQWCIFRGATSFIGPLCYGDTCYSADAAVDCGNLNGQLWNENYCAVSGYYFPAGPFCWNKLCLTAEVKNKCAELGGHVFAERWCFLEGCDWKVVGPTCSLAESDPTEQCFTDRTVELCEDLGGTQIFQRYCILKGTQWTLVGPTVYGPQDVIGPTNNFCIDLRRNLAGYFNELTTHEIDGRFCLIEGKHLPIAGPFCTDFGCNVTLGREFCNRFGGKTLADGFMCALSPAFRQAVGPLRYGDQVLEGNPELCEGEYCAVYQDWDSDVNPYCPVAARVIPGCALERNGCLPPGFNCSETLPFFCDYEEGDPIPSSGPPGTTEAPPVAGPGSSAHSSRHLSGLFITGMLILSHLVYALH